MQNVTLILCMTQPHAMGNNDLMFVITHMSDTNDLDIRPSLSQSCRIDLGSQWLIFVRVSSDIDLGSSMMANFCA